jgi:hypothetical protein
MLSLRFPWDQPKSAALFPFLQSKPSKNNGKESRSESDILEISQSDYARTHGHAKPAGVPFRPSGAWGLMAAPEET